MTEWANVADQAVGVLMRPPVETQRPGDVTPVGAQIPLFIGPCFHCGQGFVHKLPCKCPSCGSFLQEIVPASIMGAKPWMQRLWLKLTRWQRFSERLLDACRWGLQR